MKLIAGHSFRSLLTSIVYVLIFWQLWASTVSYCQSISDSANLIELYQTADGESEEEVEMNEMDEKSPIEFGELTFDLSMLFIKVTTSENAQSVHQREIITPPPEFDNC